MFPHHARSATTGKRSASTALAGTHNLVDTDPRAGTGPFPEPRALVLPLVHFGQSKPEGHSHIDTADSDLMHHQFRLSLLQWNPGPARRNSTNIVSAACGKYHALILQEASDHVPHIFEQFLVCTGNTDLAILLNKDTFEPDPVVLTYKVDSTSKGTWCMVLLIVRGLLRRPSLSGSPTVTFCSVHIHNVVAKKRDASTELNQRLYGNMREHNVDFIGGDFNMSAFSTVGDVFTDAEFSAPGNSFLWGLGALEEPNRECARFLIMPKRPYEWRVHSHGCYKFDNATCLAWDLETNLLISLCSFIFALLICPDPAASCVVNKHNKEDLSADTTKNVCRDDVHDRAPVHQVLVSVSFLTPLRSPVSLLHKPLDPKEHHCYGCRYGGGVDRRHAALARCLADVIQSHSGVKVFIEQEVPALTRVVNEQTEHARMDLVFNLNGSVMYLDVSIVAPFSCTPFLVSAASTKPGHRPRERRRANLTGTHTSISFLSFLRPLAHMPGNSLTTYCEMLTTHQ